MIDQGDRAINFELPSSMGRIVNLQNYLGKYIVLFFYPKDGTPGCTKEVCSFRDSFEKFLEFKDVVLFGISADSLKSHKNFIDKYNLPFELLSDEKFEVAKKYGVFEEKTFLKKVIKSINRTTFILNKEGIVQKVFRDVNPNQHAEEILAEVTNLKKANEKRGALEKKSF
ncbi:peroxiredoxin [Bacillus cereus]|nr:peroxiredoxin [Bacillus cereus]